MTLEDLRAFVSAYRAESLSEAARQLGCTQGAVAQHVRRLERELGAELFSRVPRGVTPTPLGRVLYEGASSALGNLETAVREIERSLDRAEGRLRLAASAAGASGALFRPSLLALKQRRPDVVIEIALENTAEGRLNALREGRADLSLVPLSEPIRGVETRPGFELELVLLVHRDHRLARRKRLQLSELASIRYIAQGQNSATYLHIERCLREIGLSLEPSEIVEEASTAVLMVELGRGETFVTARQAPGLEASGLVRSVPIPSLPPLPVGWAARSFALLPEAANEFLEVFESFVRRLS